MAVVLLALNRYGLGHLVRSTVVADALVSEGERPVLFAQGSQRTGAASRFPGRTIPSLWNASDRERQEVSAALVSMAGISSPAVVVEDTYPNPIRLPPDVRRVLLVRPTSFDWLVHLERNHGREFSAFLLCDAPDSPTWPYDRAQTDALARWDRWHVVGPVFRTPTAEEVEEVRRRYRLLDDARPLCVFTMGGGGAAEGHRDDHVRFLELATAAAEVLGGRGAAARLLFVKGPYFPPDVQIPPAFEVVEQEERMPALLKLARGAVIRAGWNTTWECLSAGTPFLPMVGDTFAEPTQARLAGLAARGLVPRDAQQLWLDEGWRVGYRRAAEGLAAIHPGTPAPRTLHRLIVDRPAAPAPPSPRPAVRAAPAGRGIPLVIRVDDVVCAEPSLRWLLGELAGRGLRASLEVVPYLVELDQRFLDDVDPGRVLFEVSQHGWAHVPNVSGEGRKHELSLAADAPADEVACLAKGKRRLEELFPDRFLGGFSAPFDAFPRWLPAAWRTLGGVFLSYVFPANRPVAPVPTARAGVDVWDWSTGRALPPAAVRSELDRQRAADGHAGVVLHPRCLRDPPDRARLVELLDGLEADGVAPASLRGCARPGPEPTSGSASRS